MARSDKIARLFAELLDKEERERQFFRCVLYKYAQRLNYFENEDLFEKYYYFDPFFDEGENGYVSFFVSKFEDECSRDDCYTLLSEEGNDVLFIEVRYIQWEGYNNDGKFVVSDEIRVDNIYRIQAEAAEKLFEVAKEIASDEFKYTDVEFWEQEGIDEVLESLSEKKYEWERHAMESWLPTVKQKVEKIADDTLVRENFEASYRMGQLVWGRTLHIPASVSLETLSECLLW